MTKAEIISLISKCAAAAQTKTEAAKAEYQRVQDPAQKQSASV